MRTTLGGGVHLAREDSLVWLTLTTQGGDSVGLALTPDEAENVSGELARFAEHARGPQEAEEGPGM